MLKRVLVIMAMLLLLLCVAHAQDGGFGGGSDAGGSSSSDSGSSSSSSDTSSSFNDSGGSGSHVIYSGKGADPKVLLWSIAFMCGAIVICERIIARRTGFTMIRISMALRDGDRYARELDGILSKGHFSTPLQRAQVIDQIASLLEQADVVDGVALASGAISSLDVAAKKAEKLARKQLDLVHIKPKIVNVEEHDYQQKLMPQASATVVAQKAEACLLCLVVVIPYLSNPITRRNQHTAYDAVMKLEGLNAYNLRSLYLCYAPNGGSSYSLDQAQEALERIKR